jgi:hypothetical protein
VCVRVCVARARLHVSLTFMHVFFPSNAEYTHTPLHTFYLSISFSRHCFHLPPSLAVFFFSFFSCSVDAHHGTVCCCCFSLTLSIRWQQNNALSSFFVYISSFCISNKLSAAYFSSSFFCVCLCVFLCAVAVKDSSPLFLLFLLFFTFLHGWTAFFQ